MMRSSRSAPTGASAKVVSAERPNTLGLGPRELVILLDMLDGQETAGASARREYSRWPFRQPGIEVRFSHPGGTATTLKLAGRNLSRGGIALLHNSYIHPGTVCEVVLPRGGSGGRVGTAGVVTRCQHRRGSLHEIGIKFNKPIRLRDFLTGAREGEVFSLESVDPARLSGQLLYVESSALDAKIVTHFLRGSTLEVQICDTGAKGVEWLTGRSAGVVMVSAKLSDGGGVDFVKTIRQRGCVSPVVIIANDPVGAMGEGLWDIADVHVLTRPFTQQRLLQQIGELLLTDDGGSGGTERRTAAAPIVSPSALEQIRMTAGELERAHAANDRPTLQDLAGQLAASAPMMGLDALGSTARRAAGALIAACRRIGDSGG
jgi:CheY-like chemotaxis protein